MSDDLKVSCRRESGIVEAAFWERFGERPRSIMNIEAQREREEWFLVTRFNKERVLVVIATDTSSGYLYPESGPCTVPFVFSETSHWVAFSAESNPEGDVIKYVFGPRPLHHVSVMVPNEGCFVEIRRFFDEVMGWDVSTQHPSSSWKSGKCVFFENPISGDIIQVTFEEMSPSTPTVTAHLAFAVVNVEETWSLIDDWCGKHNLWVEFERKDDGSMMISIPHMLSFGVLLVPLHQEV